MFATPSVEQLVRHLREEHGVSGLGSVDAGALQGLHRVLHQEVLAYWFTSHRHPGPSADLQIDL